MSDAPSAQSPAPVSAGLCCVLWSAPGTAVPGELISSLTKRVARIVACGDPFAAMAEVCSLERDRLGGRGGGGAGPSTVLLLVEPQALADAADVVTNVRLFAPGAVCWRYGTSANPKLAAVVDSDIATWVKPPIGRLEPVPASPPARPARAPDRRRHGAPRLRLAGELDDVSTSLADGSDLVVRPYPAVEQQPAPRPRAAPTLTLRSELGSDAAPPAARAVLSAEELHMLLSDDPLDAESEQGDGASPPAANPAPATPRTTER